MVKLIVSSDKTWYCKNCKVAHGNLYLVKKDDSYCELCAPEDVKKSAIKMNQNGERI